MKMFGKVKKKYAIAVVVVLVYSLLLLQIVQAVSVAVAEPGTDENPLVSQDYVDAKVNETNSKINETDSKINESNSKIDESNSKINELTASIDTLKQQLQQLQDHGTKFEIVNIKAGQKVIAGASAEIVLRSGKATAIAGTAGGVSDLISGKDLKTGNSITINHLLLVPVDDGRGLKATTEIWILIKGTYTVK
jgi:septal ring factor EnvC (AmiA/AmiB activator)